MAGILETSEIYRLLTKLRRFKVQSTPEWHAIARTCNTKAWLSARVIRALNASDQSGFAAPCRPTMRFSGSSGQAAGDVKSRALVSGDRRSHMIVAALWPISPVHMLYPYVPFHTCPVDFRGRALDRTLLPD
jgi:hypothetical protein